jgi:hypothetical protein
MRVNCATYEIPMEFSRNFSAQTNFSINRGRYRLSRTGHDVRDVYNPSSKFISKSLEKIDKEKDQSISFRKRDIFGELNFIRENYSARDWDGYDAEPVKEIFFEKTLLFLSFLPEHISCPEICAEPDGALSMVWKKRGYHVVIGVNENDRIEWGGVSPHGRLFGDVQFGNKLPEEVLNLLNLIEGFAS